MKRHDMMACAAVLSAVVPAAAATKAPRPDARPMNVLLITADDLNWNSVGFRGCAVDDVTPNLDRLAARSMIFENGHVTSAISMPSRGALMTGMYPHASGVVGFTQTERDVPTFQQTLRDHGYRLAVYGKLEHSTPTKNVQWDEGLNPGFGRSPGLYARHIGNFIRESERAGKPFFIMANSHDPHRPYSGSAAEAKNLPAGGFEQPSRTYTAREVEVAGFLPDLPAVRKELAQYFSSVRRLDDMVGAVLAELEACGVADRTIVVFLSDNGMSQPFAKTNCYLHSTRSPWIVSVPGVTRPGSVNDRDMIGGVDFMPTLLDLLRIPIPATVQGRSFAPLLKGGEQRGREYVYTEINENFEKVQYPMRAVQSPDYGYIYNAWSIDGRMFKTDSQGGLAYRAMRRAAETDEGVAERVRMFVYRAPEEFYDLKNDPDALHNLIDDPAYASRIAEFRAEMAAFMERTGDPLLGTFLAGTDEARRAYLQRQDARAEANRDNPSLHCR